MVKKILLAIFFSSALLFFGCGDDGDGGGGAGGGGVSGTWSGGGTLLGQGGHSVAFTMTLNLSQSGNAVTGTFVVNRVVLGTTSGTVSGVVGDGSLSLTLSVRYVLSSVAYGGGVMNGYITETGTNLQGTFSLTKS